VIQARHVGRHDPWRDLYLAVVDELTVPDVSKVPRPFVLLLALDIGDVDSSEMARFADEFLAVGGCVYVCTWGEGCEWLHDAFDEAFIRAVPEDRWDDEFVLTTWHDDEPLDEALWYAVFVAYNEPGVESVLAVASPEYAEHIERRFADVEQLSEDVVGE